MIKRIFLICLILIPISMAMPPDSPVAINGRLQTCGSHLCNEAGDEIQLRGPGSHGVMWYEDCYTADSVRAMAEDWGADVFRAALFPKHGNGYVNQPEYWKEYMDNLVEYTYDNGIYIMIDWHAGLFEDGGDCWYWEENGGWATEFFEYMATQHGDKGHVMYEICTEPNGATGWPRIKSYAEHMIPIIREIDPDGIILVPTPFYSGYPWDVVSQGGPLEGDLAHNVMYNFHLYGGGSPSRRDRFRETADVIPIFANEWGLSGDIGNDEAWLDLFREYKVSWTPWSWSDHPGGACLISGTCQAGGPFTGDSLTSTGRQWLEWMLEPPDEWADVEPCEDQDYYCCPVGNTCNDYRTGTGCGTGRCCASQDACVEPPVESTCADIGGTCCDSAQECSGTVQSASDCSTCCIGTCQAASQTCSDTGGECCSGLEVCTGGSYQSADDCANCCVGGTCQAVSQSTCQSEGYICCDECDIGAHSEYDADCPGQVCCESCETGIFQVGEYIEAEDGELFGAMQAVESSSVSGGYYVSSDADESGYVSFTFEIAEVANYKMQARVMTPAPTDGHNSFYIGLDDEIARNDQYVYDLEEASIFKWDDVSRRGDGNSDQNEFDPMIWTLSPGFHTFTFYGREADTRLDQVILIMASYHDADTDRDGCIDINELATYILRWKIGDIDIPDMMNAVIIWKKGC